MNPKAFLVGEAAHALKSADAYDKIVSAFLKRAEIITSMLESLSDEEIDRATFLRTYVHIGFA